MRKPSPKNRFQYHPCFNCFRTKTEWKSWLMHMLLCLCVWVFVCARACVYVCMRTGLYVVWMRTSDWICAYRGWEVVSCKSVIRKKYTTTKKLGVMDILLIASTRHVQCACFPYIFIVHWPVDSIGTSACQKSHTSLVWMQCNMSIVHPEGQG